MYPDPRELMKDDLTSADALMADGSGKSSLMKVLATGNQFHLDKTITLDGTIEYSGKDRNELLEVLPRYVAYANQIDNHYPRLTLTNFALDVMVKKLGLDSCKDTVVGNAMLRGVSGGERKRVTTGEMTVAWKRLQRLDEISTGLDSAATYDICKSTKSVAHNFNSTVVISLLQPSPEVFELFNDVVLLNEGSIMFHGKREEDVPYFERMGFHCPPRKDVADFLLGLGTDKQDVYITGDARSVPYQSADFAKLFMESGFFQKTLQRLDASTDAMVFADPKPFCQTSTEDLATLLQRQEMLTLRDTTYIMGRAVIVIVMGLLYGSAFWQMDDTDSQLMLGLLFSCAMFLSMSQASQVSTCIDARSVFYKQRGANFFRTSAHVLATSLTQIPLSILETVIFGAITYWFGGYVDDVGRFIVFLVTLFLCQMWFTSCFFFLSAAQTVGKYTLSVFNLEAESTWIWYGWIFLVAGYFISFFCSNLVLEYMRFESPENVALAQNDEAVNDQSAYLRYSEDASDTEGVRKLF
ncbi:hypothetical protein JG687_00013230 [Phytophthora cactorum]|uniref:ABC transporter domain-containing protein n=1 Tax=Phytophthora cactorum TaxID=29920 RepID=A0A8T1U4T2_9STRA|nr:hypothetical protein JG687_00013230 [Phytophthora cactorum]